LPPFTLGAFIFQSKYSFRVHFLVAMRAIFVDSSKEYSQQKSKVKEAEGED